MEFKMDVEEKFIALLEAVRKRDYSFFNLEIVVKKEKPKKDKQDNTFYINDNGFNSVVFAPSGTGKSYLNTPLGMEIVLEMRLESDIRLHLEKIRKFKSSVSDSNDLLDLNFLEIYENYYTATIESLKKIHSVI